MMGSRLSDLLNAQSLDNLVEFLLEEGDVLRMHLGQEEQIRGKNPGDDGRNKYFIVLGKDSEGNAVGFVVINSEINKNLPQEKKDMHYELKPEKYAFLNGRKRFVDCSAFRVIEKHKFNRLFSQSRKGRIEADDLKLIRTAVATWKDTPKNTVKRFGLDKE